MAAQATPAWAAIAGRLWSGTSVPVAPQPGQHLGALDLHRLQVGRVEAEQLQDRRRDLRRLDRSAYPMPVLQARQHHEDRHVAILTVIAAVLDDPDDVGMARIADRDADECRSVCAGIDLLQP